MVAATVAPVAHDFVRTTKAEVRRVGYRVHMHAHDHSRVVRDRARARDRDLHIDVKAGMEMSLGHMHP